MKKNNEGSLFIFRVQRASAFIPIACLTYAISHKKSSQTSALLSLPASSSSSPMFPWLRTDGEDELRGEAVEDHEVSPKNSGLPAPPAINADNRTLPLLLLLFPAVPLSPFPVRSVWAIRSAVVIARVAIPRTRVRLPMLLPMEPVAEYVPNP